MDLTEPHCKDIWIEVRVTIIYRCIVIQSFSQLQDSQEYEKRKMGMYIIELVTFVKVDISPLINGFRANHKRSDGFTCGASTKIEIKALTFVVGLDMI